MNPILKKKYDRSNHSSCPNSYCVARWNGGLLYCQHDSLRNEHHQQPNPSEAQTFRQHLSPPKAATHRCITVNSMYRPAHWNASRTCAPHTPRTNDRLWWCNNVTQTNSQTNMTDQKPLDLRGSFTTDKTTGNKQTRRRKTRKRVTSDVTPNVGEPARKLPANDLATGDVYHYVHKLKRAALRLDEESNGANVDLHTTHPSYVHKKNRAKVSKKNTDTTALTSDTQSSSGSCPSSICQKKWEEGDYFCNHGNVRCGKCGLTWDGYAQHPPWKCLSV